MDSAAPPTEEKKHWFEMVVTSTPVLLTVIATFLIGQSTSEMTRAQYFRSVAGQNQSKVADQWGFFQAKRIRSQILEGNADLLLAQKREPFSRSTFPDAAEKIHAALGNAEKAVGEASGKRSAKLEAKEAKELTRMVGELKALVADAGKAVDRANATFEPGAGSGAEESKVQAALDALEARFRKNSNGAKNVKNVTTSEETLDVEQTGLLRDILDDIKKRQPEAAIARKAIRLDEEVLNKAIKEADKRADDFAQRGKSIENMLVEFDSLLREQTALAFTYERLAPQFKRALGTDAPDKLDSAANAIRDALAGLQGDYKAVRNAYTARRYEDDARNNQDAAYLYEAKVYLNSARSDKHLRRSRMFLFAMLVAQAGVTIATLALAVKRRSIVWLLAALAGLIAIGFGLSVYLDLEIPL